jgi:outer membrane murein-binding lipoprotein Lpp
MAFVNVQSRPAHAPLLCPPAARKLTECHQRASIIAKIHSLSSSNQELRARNDQLENTLNDLRILLMCVGTESLHDEKELAEENAKLQV